VEVCALGVCRVGVCRGRLACGGSLAPLGKRVSEGRQKGVTVQTTRPSRRVNPGARERGPLCPPLGPPSAETRRNRQSGPMDRPRTRQDSCHRWPVADFDKLENSSYGFGRRPSTTRGSAAVRTIGFQPVGPRANWPVVSMATRLPDVEPRPAADARCSSVGRGRISTNWKIRRTASAGGRES